MAGLDRRESSTPPEGLGLDGDYLEEELPLLIRASGMAEFVDGVVRILDRRVLPDEVAHLQCRTVEEVAAAIEAMAIQGAFTLSLAGGYGMALAAADTTVPFRERLQVARTRLLRTRPTGLALRRVLDQALEVGLEAGEEGAAEAIASAVDVEARRLARQALLTGRHAFAMLHDVDAIVTHCFADRSLLYFLLEARRAGKQIHVYATETRPYLQGARLTAPSILETGHEVTLLTDGMVGVVMNTNRVGALVTAADRVCLDGTVCNKVGTYLYALAAAANDIPYVVLRQSGPDPESVDRSDVEIEYRNPDEVLTLMGKRVAPAGANALYPAFDITPPDLVDSIVTDRGRFDPHNVAAYFEEGEAS